MCMICTSSTSSMICWIQTSCSRMSFERYSRNTVCRRMFDMVPFGAPIRWLELESIHCWCSCSLMRWRSRTHLALRGASGSLYLDIGAYSTCRANTKRNATICASRSYAQPLSSKSTGQQQSSQGHELMAHSTLSAQASVVGWNGARKARAAPVLRVVV